MDIQGERPLNAPLATVWAALNDPEVLKLCIPGCSAIEQTGDDCYVVVTAIKIGPVGAKFRGELQLTDVQAPRSYTIQFNGQGGVAGFGRGSADVALAQEGAQTQMRYAARAQVGGKLAQLGSRLIEAAAGKLSESFFRAFEERVEEIAAEALMNGSAAAAHIGNA